MRVYYKGVRRTEEIICYSLYESERSITCFRGANCERRGCLANDKKMASVRVFVDVRIGSRLLGEREPGRRSDAEAAAGRESNVTNRS